MTAVDLSPLSPAATIAAVVFTLSWIVLAEFSPGFTIFGTRVAPYDWVAQSISGLGLGRTALAMNTAFALTGVLLGAGIVGILASPWGLTDGERIAVGALLLLSPVGIVGCGLFDLEHFMAHLVSFVLAMGAPIPGFALFGWLLLADPTHATTGRSLLGAAAATLVLLVSYFRSFDPERSGRGEGISGLIQRVLVTEVLATFAVLGWAAM